MDIAGGVYRELCEVPPWDAVFGSGGRAAAAVSKLSPGSALHTYGDARNAASWQHLDRLGVKLHILQSDVAVAFAYFHPLSKPHIAPKLGSIRREAPIRVRGDTVLRFGMLEGEAIVDARRAIYDPQGANTSVPFRANGSIASELALVLNEAEIQSMDMPLNALKTANASAIVVKRGPRGATVLCREGETHIPAYKSDHVFKIGSGDVFSAMFAYHWGEAGLPPAEAADLASRSVATYCDTMVLPIRETRLDARRRIDGIAPGTILLEGAIDTIGRRYTLEEARFRLGELGADVVAPALEGRPGNSLPATVLRIADGFRTTGRVADTPLVVLAEVDTSSVRALLGDSALVTNDFATALYFAVWEAMGSSR